MRKTLYIFLTLLAALVATGCANRGMGPQGGPKDSIPPVAVKSVPENGALNFHGNKIEVTFNEYIQLDNVSQNLLMSPPQQKPPVVKARGKKLMVHFEDSLRENTTYTLDFGAAVCDYTEKNPAHNYSFAFSTGDEIDTLEIHGMVVNAEDLNPVSGIVVGINNNLSDTAFTTTPFIRIAKSDSVGHFRIGNVHEGTYKLYALDDISRDNRLSPGEAMAFCDTVISPVDSSEHTLWFSREQKSKLYLQRTLRNSQNIIQLLFSAASDSLPRIRPLQPDTLRYLLSASAKRDTLNIWLADSASVHADTIRFEIAYRRTDSLYNLEWVTDTLRAVWRAPKMSERAKAAKEREERNRKLEIKSNARKSFELSDTLALYCKTPISHVIQDSIHLYERVDTLFKPVKYELLQSDQSPLTIRLLASLKEGKQYELQVDSAAISDIYNVVNKEQRFTLQMKTLEEYSTLRVRVAPYNPHIRIQVLNGKDKVLRELPAGEAGALFQNLKPDSYYLRLYIDKNGDGKWTPGNWEEHRQPEPVYYYPGKVQTKANWDFEEEWDYTATPQIQSKPSELINVGGKKK